MDTKHQNTMSNMKKNEYYIRQNKNILVDLIISQSDAHIYKLNLFDKYKSSVKKDPSLSLSSKLDCKIGILLYKQRVDAFIDDLKEIYEKFDGSRNEMKHKKQKLSDFILHWRRSVIIQIDNYIKKSSQDLDEDKIIIDNQIKIIDSLAFSIELLKETIMPYDEYLQNCDLRRIEDLAFDAEIWDICERFTRYQDDENKKENYFPIIEKCILLSDFADRRRIQITKCLEYCYNKITENK